MEARRAYHEEDLFKPLEGSRRPANLPFSRGCLETALEEVWPDQYRQVASALPTFVASMPYRLSS